MFTPFIWMFKTESFKKHFLYLFLILFKFLVPTILIYNMLNKFFPNEQLYPIYDGGCQIFAIYLPFFCVIGYFWELTSSVINRDEVIQAASVYNGKISVVEVITLPELKMLKFIWRGFASVVATIIMFIPFIMFIIFTESLGSATGMLCKISHLYEGGYIAAGIIFLFLTPAFLWNYAKENSIVATIDLRKAIYIAGNYPWRYLWCILRYVLIYAGLSFIFHEIYSYIGLYSGNIDFSMVSVLKMTVLISVAYVFYIYGLYVFAYLLGTIAPRQEA